VRLFVTCSPDFVTGGPEALHQLVHKAAVLGYDAQMVYLPNRPGPAIDAYSSYGVARAVQIADAPGSVVVVPEVFPQLLGALQHARRVVWWLSVDNALNSERQRLDHAGLGDDPWRFEQSYAPSSGYLHLAQSEYARLHLADHGASPLMLTDYLSPEILATSDQMLATPKRDVVLYNPRKGFEFTSRLIEASQDTLDWQPIVGLTPAGVAELLASSKVYVDFGQHPGRDRIPREAAMAGCCVITGSRGSAGNGVDIPIPQHYVFDETNPGAVVGIVETIRRCMADFTAVQAEFDSYRRWIASQEAVFTDEVGAFLAAVTPPVAPRFPVRRPHTNRSAHSKRKKAGRR
jgi:hypothetical protein